MFELLFMEKTLIMNSEAKTSCSMKIKRPRDPRNVNWCQAIHL